MLGHLLARSVLFTSLVLALSLGAPRHVGSPGAGMALAARAHLMRNGELAFVDRGMHNLFWRIDVFNPDGSGLRELTPPCTRSCTGIGRLSWSPNGTRLAFFRGTPTHNAGVDTSLIVIGSNGGEEKQLARCGADGCSTLSGLSWSPDGARIIFTLRGGLSIVNTRTGGPHQVTSCTVMYPRFGRLQPGTTGCNDSNPSWSRDGSRIMFYRVRFSRQRSVGEEYTMNPNGSGLMPLAPVPMGAADFALSPNGQRIVFDGVDSVYAVNADGSHLTRLVSGPRGSGPNVPSWSRDGTHILYLSTPGHPNAYREEVWVMSATGTQRRRLYRSACCIRGWGAPIWSPDGKRILFSVVISPASQFSYGTFIADADGRHRYRLPGFAGSSEALAWQPLP